MTDTTTRDHRALVAVAGQFFVNGLLTASYAARAPQIRDQLAVTVDRFGLLLTIAASAGLLGSLAAGRVVHTLSTRRVLRIGAVVTTAVLPLIGAARSPVTWLAAMMVYVVVDLMIDISMNLQGSWISARRHTPVMNRLHGVWSLGTFAGGLGAVAANAVGLSPFVHLATIALLVAMVLVPITRQPAAERRGRPRRHAVDRRGDRGEDPRAADRAAGARRHLRGRRRGGAG